MSKNFAEMSNSSENYEILSPKNQLQLFGYEYYFDTFSKLYKENKLPQTILLSGSKGSGKATFAYHFINYLLSHKEKNRYLLESFTINSKNRSYIEVCNNTHPNFFLLENSSDEENIKIDNVRKLINFLNKSTFYSDIKIVLIDNAEFLNINSSNALLKSLEEPSNNTFFILNHNSRNRILDTIRSRCVEFKFFFNYEDRKKILKNIINENDYPFVIDNVENELRFETPGKILQYLKIYNENDLDISNDKLSCIFNLVDKYKKKKDAQLLNFIYLLVEFFYNDLIYDKNKNTDLLYFNRSKILKEINNVKKFNLDKNNLFITIQGILKNEQ